MNNRRKFLAVLGAGALIACVLMPAAQSQTFPSKPIRIVVGFPPGGPADYTARLLAEKLPALLGANVIVENRVGANATIGADYVAKSPPDGHTLFLTTCGAVAISPHIGAKLPYDPLRDFAPIAQVVNSLQHDRGPSVPAGKKREGVRGAGARAQRPDHDGVDRHRQHPASCPGAASRRQPGSISFTCRTRAPGRP